MKPTGGPAFPTGAIIRKGYSRPFMEASQGITIRDYFASKAMQSMCNVPVEHESEIAEAAYKVADAMLKERSK